MILKRACIWALACMLLLLAGACAPRIEIADGDVLLSIDGEPIITGLDLSRKRTEQRISHDILGTGEMAEGELFLQMAERRTAAYMAALMGIGVDAESLEEDYDAHMADLRDSGMYDGSELRFLEALQAEFGMTDEEFRAWNVAENQYIYNAQLLAGDIVDTYDDITDSVLLEEELLGNLQTFVATLDIQISYPGVEALTFRTLL